MSRLISGKLGKVELGALLFGFISFLGVFLALNFSNTNFLKHTAQAQTATVETDQTDYSAGDMAEIYGSGWQPGESVMLEVAGEPANDPECPPDTLNVVADSEGNISNQYMIPGHGFDQTFTLMATGLESGFSANATFTNNLNSATPPAPDIEDSVLATVMTDKGDYFPTEVVQITGSGWMPGETVELYLAGEPPTHDPEVIYAEADGSGKIFAQYVVQDYDLGRTFTLTATGLTSRLTAQTTFTDANSLTYSPSSVTLNIVAGGMDSFTQTVNNPSTDSFTANPKFTGTGGSKIQDAWVSTNPTSLSFTGSGDKSWVVKISVPCGTAPGPYTGNIKADPVGGGLPGQGTGTDITVNVTADVCGNGIVCEQCDDGNTADGDCCSSTCQFESAATVCRASAGTCDVAETCTGSSASCPADAKSTAECRASAGACDLAESCDGTSNDCPADAKSTAECRASAGACDLAESCDGSSNDCPADAKSTAECRASAGACDLAESCDGTGNDCPSNGFQPAGTGCTSDSDACTDDVCNISGECTHPDNGTCNGCTIAFNGFFPPVDNPDVWNKVKAGSAIPVKFSLGCDAGLNIFEMGFPKSIMVPCDATAPVDAVEVTVNAGGSSLNYDPISGQYNYVWKTDKGWAGSCRQLTLKFSDGTMKYAYFKLTK
jgi:cysteine-rich repeat protein